MTAPARALRQTSDAELIASLAQGDLSGLGVLFDRYAADVRRVVVRLGARPADVDDLVQTTFLDVVRAADRFDGRASAKAWVLGIAVIIVRRHSQSIARLAERLARVAREPEAGSAPTPGDDLEKSETARRIERALDKLSSRKREVFVMFALEGHSGEEVAQALNIPIATVWTRLHHARKELRKQLAAEES